MPQDQLVITISNALKNNKSYDINEFYNEFVRQNSNRSKRRRFKNYQAINVKPVVSETTQPISNAKNFNKKNLFTVTPQKGVSDEKAKVKASIATQYIGFGEDIVGKDGKRSSTQIYREQAGALANTGNYSSNDVIFVSVPGLRGTAEIAKREQDKTIKEAIKALEAGATILTDNKAYTDASSYNTGEKRLHKNLEAKKDYQYSEITIDGQVLGTWSKATTQPSTSVNPSDFTNYHGGAKKYDTYWEQEGKTSGVTKHIAYTVDSYDKLDQATKDKLDVKYEAARTWLGRSSLSKDTYSGRLVRRDMMQAAKADGIFAVSEIVAPGTKGRKGYVNKTNHPIIEGGTGYAVASGILLNKPVYVFNQDSNYGYDTGWYKWDSSTNNFVKTDIPVLTKNYAGIGSSTNETEIGRQAIRDVYANTFKATTQQQTEVKEGVEELFNSKPELAVIGTPQQYSKWINYLVTEGKLAGTQSKDIVYRGSEDTGNRDYLYFTKVKGEAYAFSKANITKGGNITERNPINAIDTAAEKYFNSKYGKDVYSILTLEDNFAARIYESLDPLLLDENYNLTKKGQKEFEKLKAIDSRKKELLKTVSEQDKFLLENIKIVKSLYNKVKIESEADLTKPYDDTDYQENINEYNRARKTIDEILSPSEVRKNIGVITTALINIKDPYIDEIVQEDLKNNRDAFKNGHDGAILNDGDNFLVKPEQVYELGTKQDIQGFKEFVSKPGQQEVSLEEQIQLLEYRLSELENNKALMEDSIPVIVAKQLPKITPESAMKETGVKIGTVKDINPSLLSKNGVSVERAAELLTENELTPENGFPEVDMQDVRNYIIEILQIGTKNFIAQYTNQNEIDNIVLEIKNLKESIKEKSIVETDISLEAGTEDLFNLDLIAEANVIIAETLEMAKNNPEVKQKLINFIKENKGTKIETQEQLEKLKNILC
jgi:hypothetical protein